MNPKSQLVICENCQKSVYTFLAWGSTCLCLECHQDWSDASQRAFAARVVDDAWERNR
jgi:hypothetical protein